MGRSPCCDESSGLKKGPWTPEEDQKLVRHIQQHGHGSWRALPKLAGLNRCGKSCRLRWTNYLRPDIKRGKFSQEEEQTILNLHSVLGNKWSAIASHLPGRTDNEIKNFWNTHLKKKLIQMGFDPMTHRPRTDIFSSLNLLALANLVDQHAWGEQAAAAARLQTEAIQVARLQYLQYLLQAPSPAAAAAAAATASSSSPPPLADQHLEPLNFLSSLSSLKDDLQLMEAAAASAQSLPHPMPGLDDLSIPFEHLPELDAPCSFQQAEAAAAGLSGKGGGSDRINNGRAIADFGAGNCEGSGWMPGLSPPPPLAAPSSLPVVDSTGASAATSFNQGEACSGGSAASYGGGSDGVAAAAAAASFWPDLLFDDPLFHEIA